MSESARQETMLRKPILMPPSMIDKVDKIARNRKVSFAEVVRQAVNAFDGDLSREDEALLNERLTTLIDKVNRMDQDIRHMNDISPLPYARYSRRS